MFVFFCLQPKINIPEFLSASEITDVSDSELELDEDEPDDADLSYVESEIVKEIVLKIFTYKINNIGKSLI
jgi:hypothetical protein